MNFAFCGLLRVQTCIDNKTFACVKNGLKSPDIQDQIEEVPHFPEVFQIRMPKSSKSNLSPENISMQSMQRRLKQSYLFASISFCQENYDVCILMVPGNNA